jgi:ribonuclease P protein component
MGGFPPTERLHRRSEFQKVYGRGVKAHGRFMMLTALPNALPFARLGVAATRKLGGAVARNRAKRLIREVFRRSNWPQRGMDVVVIPRRELFDAAYEDFEADFRNTLKRCAARLPATSDAAR